MTRRGTLALVAGAAMLLAGCGGYVEGASGSYRFRMTVTVDTPSGTRTGSSVYEVTAGYTSGFMVDPSGKVRRWGVRGEAVAVDLPGGKTLFALLKSSANQGDLASLSMTALDPAYKNDLPESAQRISNGVGIRSPATVSSRDYPLLVTFRDIADPRSVERVDPADLAKSFGAGVSLKAITVAVTDDPVTTGIEKRLEWLANSKVMDNPGWGALPYESRTAINGLFSGTIGRSK